MTDPKILEVRTVLMADLPDRVKDDPLIFKQTVIATIEYYKKLYGDVRKVWINPRDAPDSMPIIDGIKIEKKGGCIRHKIMVM